MGSGENVYPEKTVEGAEECRDGNAEKKNEIEGVDEEPQRWRGGEEDVDKSSREEEEEKERSERKDTEQGEDEKSWISHTITPSRCESYYPSDSDEPFWLRDEQEVRSKYRERLVSESSPSDTFVPTDSGLENAKWNLRSENDTLERLEVRLAHLLKRDSVCLPPDLISFFDQLEGIDQNWNGEKKKRKRDAMEKTERSDRKRDVDEDAVKDDDHWESSIGGEDNVDTPSHENEEDRHGEKEKEMARRKKSGKEIHVDSVSRFLFKSGQDMHSSTQEPVGPSSSPPQCHGVPSLPFLSTLPIQVQPSGVYCQMERFLSKKARTASYDIANESCSESTGSKPTRTFPHAISQSQPQQSLLTNQSYQRKGCSIDYDLEFIATIFKRNQRKSGLRMMNLVLDQQEEKRTLMEAVLAYYSKAKDGNHPIVKTNMAPTSSGGGAGADSSDIPLHVEVIDCKGNRSMRNMIVWDLHELQNGLRVVMPFPNGDIPSGDSLTFLGQMTDILSRDEDYLPIIYDDWEKDRVWDEVIMEKLWIDEEVFVEARKYIESEIDKKWKDYKDNLYKKHWKDWLSFEDNMIHAPKRISPKNWKIFVKQRLQEASEKLRNTSRSRNQNESSCSGWVQGNGSEQVSGGPSDSEESVANYASKRPREYVSRAKFDRMVSRFTNFIRQTNPDIVFPPEISRYIRDS